MSNTTIIKNPTWWHRRTMLERGLTVITAVAFLACVLLAVALSTILLREAEKQGENMPSASASVGGKTESAPSRAGQGRHKEDWNLCLTSGCVATANAVLQNMDRKVDPCDNFYEFACGKFVEESRIPDDKSSLTTFSVINDKLQEQLRDILDQPISSHDIKPFVYAKNLFKACMNKTLIEEKSATPVLSILKELGGWPVLEGSDWNEAEWDWKKSVYTFREKGFSVDYFLDFSVGVDLKNSTVRVIDLDQATLALSREYLVKGLSDKLVAAYYDYMVDIAVLYGADKNVAKTELKKSLDFEINLANMSLPLEERRNATKLYNPMTLPELQQKFPSIPWTEYFRNLLPDKIKISPDEFVIVNVPSYIHKLEALMSNTPKRVQANYALWRAAGASVSYLSDNFRRRQLEYSTVLSGRTEIEARWKECTDVASGSLSLAVGSQYVRRFFKEDAKKNAEELVLRVRQEMYKILEHVEWMDDKTRAAALDKAKSMTTHIAYPDELLDDEKLMQFYENLEIGSDDYYGAILNLTKFGTEYSFSRLRDAVNKSEWITHGRPAIVNAFYSSIENSIQFPAGILQGTFFNKDRPHYMNYGAIGFVIGHEITHGFDDQGRQFNKDGNLVDWWQEETKKKYLEKAMCIIHQYGNYTAHKVNLKLNGINTQGENIADNGGIKEAYYAYQSWEKEHGAEARLPGLQMYTPQQMFWISAANSWCSKYRDESLKNRITTGFHSPGEFRVIGPLSNLKEFSKDFSCPSGSKMNPPHKCSVW
ncbi:neprilysin-2 [Nilaparvata lugens]|uniref:Seminal fluid protein n=1 Tax=Nilaparvata lugens TaxID=108931 RepID=A0A1I9WLF9_NILLU|nr:neprilysin-2 [Nilaparvata lugens]XP_039280392.1 neprilysin-2 [Nilaparvata lugens]APA33979.1 seminal fluid protein [Nilaparvata lugens]